MTMCPDMERVERERNRRLSIFEIIPGTEKERRPRANPETCVKEYSRSAAGRDIDQTRLRPPSVLLGTMDFLVDNIVARTEHQHRCVHAYDFVSDRIRSVVQDMIVQRADAETSINILQRAVRFHILFLTELRNVKDFNKTLCFEQLCSYLSSLLIHSETPLSLEADKNAEFSIYQLLLHFDSDRAIQDFLYRTRPTMPLSESHTALQLVLASSTGNFFSVFRMCEKLPYLMSCCMVQHLNILRARALDKIQCAFYCKSFRLPVPVMTYWLKFDNDEDTVSFCKNFGMSVVDGFLTSKEKGKLDLAAVQNLELGSSFKLLESKKKMPRVFYVNHGE